MQGRKNYSEKLFVSFQLSDRIPKENFYRRLNETLDLQFLYRDTRGLYGKTGKVGGKTSQWEYLLKRCYQQ